MARRVQARITQKASADCDLSEIDGHGLQSSLLRGWYYGPERFPDKLLTRAATLLQQRTQVRRNYHSPELREHGQQAAQCLLEAGLRLAKLCITEFPDFKKAAPLKAQIAFTIHAQTAVPPAWIPEALSTGTPSNISPARKRCSER